MVRAAATAKHKTTKLVFLCVALLGAALIADLLWASSSSSSSSAYQSIFESTSRTFILPSFHKTTTGPALVKDGSVKGSNKNGVRERLLSATFADLPAPELKWEKMATAPVPRLDGAAIQMKNLLFVFAGYGTIDYVRTLPSLFRHYF